MTCCLVVVGARLQPKKPEAPQKRPRGSLHERSVGVRLTSIHPRSHPESMQKGRICLDLQGVSCLEVC